MVVLFVAGNSGIYVKQALQCKGIKIAYFCDNDEKMGGGDNVEIISPSYLCEIYSKKLLIQIGSIYDKEVERQLISYGIDSFICYEEYCDRIKDLVIYKTLPKSLEVYKTLYSEPSYIVSNLRKGCLDYAVRVNYFNIVCLPSKTGNHTIVASIQW